MAASTTTINAATRGPTTRTIATATATPVSL